MGFEVRRRDWTELAKEVQRWLFSVLGSTIEQKTTIDDVWVNIIKPKIDVLYEELLAGKLDGKIVYTKNMKRDITAYKSSLPHTRAAQILIDRGLLGPREPIKYIIVKVERQKVPVFKDGKPIMYKRDPTKQRQKSKKVIVTYPLISDRPAIELSGYEYAWKSQVLAMLDRFGLLTKYVSPDAVKEVNEASHTTGVITMMLK